MSADISECMSDVWTRWQGHLINGVYPLGRYLGCSDHSGVFLTKSAARSRADIAIKLVPANRALAEFQLPRWKRAGGLAHPHLLRMFEWGGCQLDGSPYLYVLMEHADQTLAQLLLRRALTDDEAREMLTPVLDALAFLHERDLVHGQVKPANVLVVGDQLKLSSDTIHRIGERRPTAQAPSVYESPEAVPGAGSPGGDVWALGVTLCEALTRKPPSIAGERGDGPQLPIELSREFRDLIAPCLSLRSQDRPRVAEVSARVRGQAVESVPIASLPPAVQVQPPAPTPPRPEPPPMPAVEIYTAEAAPPTPTAVPPREPRTPLGALLGAVLIVALGWGGWHLLRKHASSSAESPALESPGASRSTASGPVERAGGVFVPGTDASAETSPANGSTTASQPLHEMIPAVPLSARRTIRGHIKVWVRIIVDSDGTVFAADVDRPGPSRYFQRLALQAAKKWTFPPLATSERRLMQIRFEFSREGTSGRAVPMR